METQTATHRPTTENAPAPEGPSESEIRVGIITAWNAALEDSPEPIEKSMVSPLKIS